MFILTIEEIDLLESCVLIAEDEGFDVEKEKTIISKLRGEKAKESIPQNSTACPICGEPEYCIHRDN